MRRDIRKRMNQDEDLNMKIIKYSCIGIAILTVIVFALLIYSKKLNNEVKEGTLTSEQISSIFPASSCESSSLNSKKITACSISDRQFKALFNCKLFSILSISENEQFESIAPCKNAK